MPKTPDFERELTDNIEYFYDETSPLSNVYNSEIVYEGVRYKSAEQAYQAQKFDPETDNHVIAAIMMVSQPGQAKEISGAHRKRIVPDWDKKKFRIMIGIVYQKMLQHPEIAELLVNSQEKLLVEDAPKDNCWGMVTNETGVVSGSNFMGRVLMFVRWRLEREA